MANQNFAKTLKSANIIKMIVLRVSYSGDALLFIKSRYLQHICFQYTDDVISRLTFHLARPNKFYGFFSFYLMIVDS